MTTACATGMIILFGEHAVVYDRPAIAVPVREVIATAEVHTNSPPAEVAPGSRRPPFAPDGQPGVCTARRARR